MTASELRRLEAPQEVAVSAYIAELPVLCLPVPDPSGPGSARGFIERNSIALLSNWNRSPIDRPSAYWLGRYCKHERVRASGLWNNNHVDEAWDPRLLTELDDRIGAVAASKGYSPAR